MPDPMPSEYGGPVSHAIFRVAKAHRATAGALLRSAGLHPGQELMMIRLWQDGPLSHGDLAAALGVDASTITRMVQRLEQAGFVRRQHGDTDRRTRLVAPTAASLALRETVAEAWRELERRTLDGLAPDEVAALHRLLDRVEDNLTRAAAPPSPAPPPAQPEP